MEVKEETVAVMKVKVGQLVDGGEGEVVTIFSRN